MATAHRVIRNVYRHSVSMMQLSASLRDLPGVEQASATMATPANLDMLREAGMLAAEPDAGTSDLLVVVKGPTAAALEAALATAEAQIRKPPQASPDDGVPAMPPASLQMALERTPDANFALISTPGEYAAAEARKALALGLSVMLFSDNVPVHEEVALKTYARAHGRLVMGPDCGTAIVDGIPLGFANVVRRGAIGVVGASGTGTQQVTCLVHRYGEGISQALGTGGRDLRAEVGGITMLQGLDALARDAATRVIVLVSKPPAPEVAARVLAAARKVRKPVVVNFVGADATAQAANLHFARTLDDASRAAVALANGRAPARRPSARIPPRALDGMPRLARGQRYLRGLYSGGTFCYEACALLGDLIGTVRSNAPVDHELELADVWQSVEHTVVDLGDDEFTRGRPHPMIDQTLRNERLVKEADDPSVAVILLDVVLGYGAHPDPATSIAAAVKTARVRAARQRRRIAFVGFICGTDADPQDYARQESALRSAGVILADSNAQAVRVAAAIARRQAPK
jgi:succinyl-CoA synthetase alpha subunit